MTNCPNSLAHSLANRPGTLSVIVTNAPARRSPRTNTSAPHKYYTSRSEILSDHRKYGERIQAKRQNARAASRQTSTDKLTYLLGGPPTQRHPCARVGMLEIMKFPANVGYLTAHILRRSKRERAPFSRSPGIEMYTYTTCMYTLDACDCHRKPDAIAATVVMCTTPNQHTTHGWYSDGMTVKMCWVAFVHIWCGCSFYAVAISCYAVSVFQEMNSLWAEKLPIGKMYTCVSVILATEKQWVHGELECFLDEQKRYNAQIIKWNVS